MKPKTVGGIGGAAGDTKRCQSWFKRGVPEQLKPRQPLWKDSVCGFRAYCDTQDHWMNVWWREVIEAVQRDALDAMGNLFTHTGDGPIGEPLSPRSLPLSSRLSSNASNEVTQMPLILVELRGFEPLTPTLPVWCATNCAIAPSRANRSYTTGNCPSKLLLRPAPRRPDPATDLAPHRASAAFPVPTPSRPQRSAE